MQEELSSYNPYKYKIDHSKQALTYIFKTDIGIKYEVYFIVSRGDFPFHPHLDNQTYTFGFGLSVEYYSPSIPIPRARIDPRVKDTIIDILQKILREDKDIALLYICSSSGERQSVTRNRLFNAWFREKDPSKLFGIDLTKYDLNVSDTYLSLLVKNDNRYFNDFQEAIQIFKDEIKAK